MTVIELIDKLQKYDKDMEVVIQGANSGGYVDWTRGAGQEILNSFWSDDEKEVVVIYADDQAGRIRD